jgi:thymidylate synthase
MNKLDKQYQQLLQDIIDYGVEKKDRTGTGTKSIFGYTIRHKMSDGFPLLTTKKMAWKTMVTELLWFLRGDTNIKYLVDNNCHIWDGDAYKNYINKLIFNEKDCHVDDLINQPNKTFVPYSQEEFINKIKTDDKFANKWGDLGPIYGAQWRNWIRKTTRDEKIVEPGVYETSIDQIQNLINDLKTNPDSRRMMVNAWNVGELDQMVLPPCHYGFQVYTRELSPLEIIEQSKKDGLWQNEIPEGMTLSELQKDFKTRAISLMWNQRSVDTFLGLPFNIASYGLLLEIIAKEVNMVPDQLIGNLGDTHLYLNHIEQAKEQIGRELTLEERMDWWFKNHKPNRDVCDHVDEESPYGKGVYFDSSGVPKRTREPFELPTLRIASGPLDDIAHHEIMDFDILNYQSHPSIKAPLSN